MNQKSEDYIKECEIRNQFAIKFSNITKTLKSKNNNNELEQKLFQQLNNKQLNNNNDLPKELLQGFDGLYGRLSQELQNLKNDLQNLRGEWNLLSNDDAQEKVEKKLSQNREEMSLLLGLLNERVNLNNKLENAANDDARKKVQKKLSQNLRKLEDSDKYLYIYDQKCEIRNRNVIDFIKALGIAMTDEGNKEEDELMMSAPGWIKNNGWKGRLNNLIVISGFTEVMIFVMFAIWGKALLAPSTALIPMLFAVFFIATAIYMVFESFKALMKKDPDVENENENKGDDGGVSLFTKNLNSYLFQDEWKGKPLSQRRILDIAGLLGSSLVAVAAGIEMAYKFSHFMVLGKSLLIPAPPALLVIGLAILAIKAMYCIYRESKYIKEIDAEISKTKNAEISKTKNAENEKNQANLVKLVALKGKVQDVKTKNWISLFCAVSIISFAVMFFVFPGVAPIACVALAIAAAVFTFLDRVVKLTRSGRPEVEKQLCCDQDDDNVYIKNGDKKENNEEDEKVNVSKIFKLCRNNP